MIISISGMPGSGKSTVSHLLAKKLGYKEYSIGDMRREMAKKRGMTLEEYNKFGEENPSTDREVDEYQKKLGKKEDNFIIQGRTSFHFIPDSVKVYLDVDLKEAARRIFRDIKKDPEKRNEGSVNSEEEMLASIKRRVESDKARYRKYYGFDAYDPFMHDILIDTTDKSPEEVVKAILSYLKDQKI